MGAKQTKMEEISSDIVGEIHTNQSKPIELEAMHVEGQDFVQNEMPPKPVENLRKRFFKGFTYNLNDPRSPSLFMNRTPLVFDDLNDKTFNLDDTFADLFVASRNAPVQENVPQSSIPVIISQNNIVQQVEGFKAFEKSLSVCGGENEVSSVEFTSLIEEEETMASPAVLKQTPITLQQAIDPRSPAAGRTPILFDNDDESHEDAMLEDILATLSLDFSSASSSNSFSTALASPMSTDMKKPINKQLDRLRSRKPEKSIRKIRNTQKHRIYLDGENSNVTPKRKSSLLAAADGEKRTPLSCVKNRVHHLRSRSVESNGKSPKQKLSLTSYDDNLNPVQDPKVMNLHALQGDPFDF